MDITTQAFILNISYQNWLKRLLNKNFIKKFSYEANAHSQSICFYEQNQKTNTLRNRDFIGGEKQRMVI